MLLVAPKFRKKRSWPRLSDVSSARLQRLILTTALCEEKMLEENSLWECEEQARTMYAEH